MYYSITDSRNISYQKAEISYFFFFSSLIFIGKLMGTCSCPLSLSHYLFVYFTCSDLTGIAHFYFFLHCIHNNFVREYVAEFRVVHIQQLWNKIESIGAHSFNENTHTQLLCHFQACHRPNATSKLIHYSFFSKCIMNKLKVLFQ